MGDVPWYRVRYSVCIAVCATVASHLSIEVGRSAEYSNDDDPDSGWIHYGVEYCITVNTIISASTSGDTVLFKPWYKLDK